MFDVQPVDDYTNAIDGVANGTPPFIDVPPDASGGAGSYLDSIVGTLTGGFNALANIKINEYIGKSLQGGLASVDANGRVVYKAAAGQQAPATIAPSYAAKSFFGSTAGILTVAGIALGLVFLVARR